MNSLESHGEMEFQSIGLFLLSYCVRISCWGQVPGTQRRTQKVKLIIKQSEQLGSGTLPGFCHDAPRQGSDGSAGWGRVRLKPEKGLLLWVNH